MLSSKSSLSRRRKGNVHNRKSGHHCRHLIWRINLCRYTKITVDHGTKEMLGVVGWKVWQASNFAQQHATTSNNIQQGVKTDATCNIQQCWQLLANNVARGFNSQRLDSSGFRLRANGRNIVGQQLPTLLDVTCCVRLYNNSQHCWRNNVGICCVRLHAALQVMWDLNL